MNATIVDVFRATVEVIRQEPVKTKDELDQLIQLHNQLDRILFQNGMLIDYPDQCERDRVWFNEEMMWNER